MADTKISALTAATTPLAGTEVLPIVQSGVTKQVSVANLTAGRAVSADSLTLTGSPLPATSGGTGQSSYAVGDLLYASTTTALSKLADVATGNALISGGVGAAPSWGKIGLTTHVSGTLAVGNGGTGNTTGAATAVTSNATTGVMQIVGPAAASTRVMTIPDANFTVARTDAAQTFTGTQVFSSLPQITAATANRILYADGSQVMATSTYMQFDGTKVQFGQGTFSVGDNDVGLSVTSSQRTNLKITSTETGGQTWIFQTAGTGNYGSGAAQLRLGPTGFATGVYITATGTSWSALSDERLKNIIEPISNALFKVSQLRAVIGNYKTDPSDIRRSFLIAQDVEKVLPEAITKSQRDKNSPEYLGVQYDDVIPLLAAAINELSEKFESYRVTHT